MSFPQTVALGALAGLTIFIGLPVGRMRVLGRGARVALAMFSVGVLAFIFVDVLSHAITIVNTALDSAKHHHSSVAHLVWLVVLLGAGFAAGSAGLAMVERHMRPAPQRRAPIAGGADGAVLTGAEADAFALDLDAARRGALRTGLTIAGAIGVHNFAEGLAIGVSAQAGEISLATVLIVGFALHNATEGFGIIGPLGGVRPSWKWIGVAGLIAGGPVWLGSMVGYNFTSHPLELTFYALAGGAILYVVGEVWQGMRRYGHQELGLVLLSMGFLAAVATDMVVAYGGG